MLEKKWNPNPALKLRIRILIIYTKTADSRFGLPSRGMCKETNQTPILISSQGYRDSPKHTDICNYTVALLFKKMDNIHK